jgi:thiamine biosynthesis protein ThiS
MQVKLNGKPEDIKANTLAELVKLKGFNCARVVIEHNLKIVSEEKLGEIILNENDVIEVLAFIGGG